MKEKFENSLMWIMLRLVKEFENLSSSCLVCREPLGFSPINMTTCDKETCIFGVEENFLGNVSIQIRT
jgi:hypothetical protein